MSMLFPASSPHGHQGHDTGQLMRLVLLACIPGFAAQMFFFGWGVLLNVVWTVLVAVACEAAVLKLRKRDVVFYLRDYTAVLTAVLMALALPSTAPWYVGMTGILFAIVAGKHLYGGMGHNPFNPAMVGYAVLLVSFPLQMTRYLLPNGVGETLPSFTDSLLLFAGSEPLQGIDAYTGATALDAFRQQRGEQLVSEFWRQSPVMGQWSGAGWEWINAGYLFGGVFLLYRRIISWHIPAGMLGALALLAALFHDGGSSQSHGSPLMHLFAGATMLGAFFIATDPVTAATTPRGRIIYGVLIGALVYVIRAHGSYPDGVAFAVLLGNFATPLIDTLTVPRTYGHKT